MCQCLIVFQIPNPDLAYALSFAERFFLDDDPEQVAASEQPTSVYQAIVSIREDQWSALAREVFQIESRQLDPLMILERIRRTNTCSNLDVPVRVWIDELGEFDVLVYDGA